MLRVTCAQRVRPLAPPSKSLARHTPAAHVQCTPTDLCCHGRHQLEWCSPGLCMRTKLQTHSFPHRAAPSTQVPLTNFRPRSFMTHILDTTKRSSKRESDISVQRGHMETTYMRWLCPLASSARSFRADENARFRTDVFPERRGRNTMITPSTLMTTATTPLGLAMQTPVRHQIRLPDSLFLGVGGNIGGTVNIKSRCLRTDSRNLSLGDKEATFWVNSHSRPSGAVELAWPLAAS